MNIFTDLVSIIVPCYNNELTIKRAIESIINQTYKCVEIICIDDCSSDRTVEILETLSIKNKLTIVKNKRNFGPSYSRNIGIENAKGKYIAFLDSDDYWHPQKLAIQLQFLQQENLDFIGTLAKPNINSSIEINRSFLTLKKISFNQLLFKNRFATPTVLMKKSICIPFNVAQRYSEDYFLWLQLARRSNKKFGLIVGAYLVGLDKDVYGVSGLSANLWEMEKNELINYLYFMRKGSVIALFMIPFSLIKFVKRLLVSTYKKIF